MSTFHHIRWDKACSQLNRILKFSSNQQNSVDQFTQLLAHTNHFSFRFTVDRFKIETRLYVVQTDLNVENEVVQIARGRTRGAFWELPRIENDERSSPSRHKYSQLPDGCHAAFYYDYRWQIWAACHSALGCVITQSLDFHFLQVWVIMSYFFSHLCKFLLQNSKSNVNFYHRVCFLFVKFRHAVCCCELIAARSANRSW